MGGLCGFSLRYDGVLPFPIEKREELLHFTIRKKRSSDISYEGIEELSQSPLRNGEALFLSSSTRMVLFPIGR